MNTPSNGLILVTGETGCVGGGLVPLLAGDGRRVRCLARHPERLVARVPEGSRWFVGMCSTPHRYRAP
jgi:uncharacterized protein YbjT (DUF2867 family)